MHLNRRYHSGVITRLLAVILTVAFATPLSSQTPSAFDVHEATIAQIHSALQAKRITCRGLVEQYLQRISVFDKNGPAISIGVLRRADSPVRCTACR
jgi:amidase